MNRSLAAGAAVLGIIWRRLQPGAGPKTAFAAIDRRIQQFRQRRPDRLHVGPMRLRFGGFAGLLGIVGILRHGANMGSQWPPDQSNPDYTYGLHFGLWLLLNTCILCVLYSAAS
jgi:hypothetical protein